MSKKSYIYIYAIHAYRQTMLAGLLELNPHLSSPIILLVFLISLKIEYATDPTRVQTQAIWSAKWSFWATTGYVEQLS